MAGKCIILYDYNYKNIMKKLLLLICLIWSTNAYTCNDHKEAMCLAKAIYWESRGEHLLGQLAVVSVITERIKDPYFPNDICSVVYQINKKTKKPEFSTHIVKNSKPIEIEEWRKSQKLAHDIISGNFKYQLAFKARYFHSTKISPKWKHKWVATIGNNKFYY